MPIAPSTAGLQCDLYHLDAVAYESLIIGTFALFYYK